MFRRLAASLLICAIAYAWTVSPNYGQQDQQQQQPEYSLAQLIEMLGKEDDPAVRMNAAAELLEHKDQVDKFVKPLAAMFLPRDELVVLTAQRVFHRLGADAVDALEGLLRSSDIKEFKVGCMAVNAIGDPAEKWREFLIEKLRSSQDPDVQVAAMFGLTGFSNGCPEVVEDVAGKLNQPEYNGIYFNNSLWGCRLLTKTGRRAKPAVTELVKLLENGNLSQRTYAAWTLGAIGKTDQFDTLSALTEMLGKYTYTQRERAMRGLGLMGKDAAGLADRVTDIMNKPGTNLEARAALTLWQITGETQPTVDRLVDLSKQSDFELVALQMLGEMGPAAAAAAEYLVERTKSPDESIREAAAEALGNLGKQGREYKQALFQLLEDPDPLVRLSANIAIENITLDQDEN